MINTEENQGASVLKHEVYVVGTTEDCEDDTRDDAGELEQEMPTSAASKSERTDTERSKVVEYSSSWRDDATSLTAFEGAISTDSSWRTETDHIHNEYVFDSESGNSVTSGYSYVIAPDRYGRSSLQKKYVKKQPTFKHHSTNKPFCSVVSATVDTCPKPLRKKNIFRYDVQQGDGLVFDRLYQNNSDRHTEMSSDDDYMSSERSCYVRDNYSRCSVSSNKTRQKKPFCSVVGNSIESYPKLRRQRKSFACTLEDTHSCIPIYERLNLYAIDKQLEGKRRREQLKKLSNKRKMARNGELVERRKISASRGSEIYYRGMMHKLRRDGMSARSPDNTSFKTKLNLNQMLDYYEILKGRTVSTHTAVATE